MYDLSGLADDLMVSGKEAAAIGSSALVGAGIAKVVVSGLANAKKGKDERADKTVADTREKLLPAWVPPLAPIAVGLAVHNYGKARFPLAAPGVAAGMVAVGLGQLVGELFIKKEDLDKADSNASKTIRDYVPFSQSLAGLGSDVYDYSLMGFGIGPGDVSAYMRLGSSPFTSTPAAGTSIMSPGAPVQITTLKGLGAGAPTQVQVISTTPSMSAALVG